MMNAFRWTLLLLTLSVLSFAGCDKPADDGADGDDTSAAAGLDTETIAVTAAVLCGKCGEEKGSDQCCAAGAEACSGCGKHKGTALCCANLAGDAAGKDICSSCGHVAEASHTCDTNGEKCADCGLHKGSPACCKLKS